MPDDDIQIEELPDIDGKTLVDVVDDEDAGRSSHSVSPWDPAKIRITTKHFSLWEVNEQVKARDLDLSPDFQRDYVWKKRQRTRLIESILLGIPLPAFYFNQDNGGNYQVVDGVQRLSTIALFMRNEHVLDKDDLEYLTDLHGKTYDALDPATIRRFRSTQIVVHVIEPQTPDEVKYDIFSRVNTLGSPLSAQEIRHAMSCDRSKRFLKKLSEMHEFDEATEWQYWRPDPDSKGKRIRYSGRMTNRELALRFCAFRHFSDAEYRRYISLDSFLAAYTKRLDGRSDVAPMITDEELNRLESDYKRAMINAHQILGKAAFRRLHRIQNRRGPINRAIFESQAIALANYAITDLLPKKNEIFKVFRDAFNDPDYERAVTVATGDLFAIKLRLQYTKDILMEILK